MQPNFRKENIRQKMLEGAKEPGNRPDVGDVRALASFAKTVLCLEEAELSGEYYYQSLPLCVVDAVFSIGVRYEGVRAVVSRYCDYASQPRIRTSAQLPPKHEQESIRSFCQRFEGLTAEEAALSVFQNRQRTSTRSGILKADATIRFARVLQAHDVNYLQDIAGAALNHELEQDLRAIPGQRSGISLYYFWMLAGSDDFVKPDRMLLRFVQTALGRDVSVEETAELVKHSAYELRSDYPLLSPRLLDHEIWKHQRQKN